ncbi:uncharacterized protein EI90DRAFT_3126619 [Cantharellus anzutake]|uniref:uncharacterized protein n=1 Tax=Cantharellus anzutake TaxID=1750568 RepID=UPI0019045347|nr:uncharacterized protein EI90DRAFT_3126619 [Cantharellus anzutake]KAF8327974.1 hypothetical protein EI90DRAFT_3126619 [Cantharellus anzutake]
MSDTFKVDVEAKYKLGKIWGFAVQMPAGLDLCQVKVVVQWRVPKSPDTLVQHFGRAGRDGSIQAIAILIAEKAYFSKPRVDKRKADLEASLRPNLKCKNGPPHGPPSDALVDLPLPEVRSVNAQRTDEEFQDDDDDDGAESNEEENLMDYPFDGPTNPEGAQIPRGDKTKSSKPHKSGRHSKYENIESSVAEFLYADMLPESHPQLSDNIELHHESSSHGAFRA